MAFLAFSAAMILLLQVAGAFMLSEGGKSASKKKPEKDHHRIPSTPDASSWPSFRKLIACRYDAAKIQQPKKRVAAGRYEKIVCHASALCSLKAEDKNSDQNKVTKGVQASDKEHKKAEKVSRKAQADALITAPATASAAPAASGSAPVRRWSACSECRVMNTMLGPLPLSSVKVCPSCSQSFSSAEALARHHASKHAVTELNDDDSAKNVVEIIFKTSWLKTQERLVSIERILKIHNTQSTLDRFEEYREMIKAKAKRHPHARTRCMADGNELLRFRCVSVACSLGDSTLSLCSLPSCHACHVITHGFPSPDPLPLQLAPDQQCLFSGVCTAAGSATAHDWMTSTLAKTEGQRRAMLVCRVIAGRVHRSSDFNASDGVGVVDSVSRAWHARSPLEEVTGNSRLYMGDEIMVCPASAVLPCFVVLYRTSSFD